jgi:hypothetical protein
MNLLSFSTAQALRENWHDIRPDDAAPLYPPDDSAYDVWNVRRLRTSFFQYYQLVSCASGNSVDVSDL